MLATLPDWFWIIYYSILLITLGATIFSLVRKKLISLSIIAIIFTMTIPLVSLIYSIGRSEGHNEFEHLFSQLQQGAIWSIYVSIGYLYLLIWWLLFFNDKELKKK